jgi:hypothetical protein
VITGDADTWGAVVEACQEQQLAAVADAHEEDARRRLAAQQRDVLMLTSLHIKSPLVRACEGSRVPAAVLEQALSPDEIRAVAEIVGGSHSGRTARVGLGWGGASPRCESPRIDGAPGDRGLSRQPSRLVSFDLDQAPSPRGLSRQPTRIASFNLDQVPAPRGLSRQPSRLASFNRDQAPSPRAAHHGSEHARASRTPREATEAVLPRSHSTRRSSEEQAAGSAALARAGMLVEGRASARGLHRQASCGHTGTSPESPWDGGSGQQSSGREGCVPAIPSLKLHPLLPNDMAVPVTPRAAAYPRVSGSVWSPGGGAREVMLPMTGRRVHCQLVAAGASPFAGSAPPGSPRRHRRAA